MRRWCNHRCWSEAPRLCLPLFIAAAIAFTDSVPVGAAQLLSTRDASVAAPAGGNGYSVAPWISPDGRFVVFSSSASDLVSGDNGYLGTDVFQRDRASNVTVLVSANLNGTGGANGSSMFGLCSTNGRYVVFQSDASDLVSGDTNGVNDIFVRDLLAGTTTLVSVAVAGGPANGASSDAVMTPDGRYVAFISAATNLVVGDTNKFPDVFVRDLVGGTTQLASVGANTPVNAMMATPVITPDGRYVAFFSNARGLVASVPATATGEIYVRDLVGNSTIWASTNAATLAQAAFNLLNLASSHPAISDDGRFVAFKTGTTNTSARMGVSLILQFDAVTGSTAVAHTNACAFWVQNDDIYGPEMSPDGRFIAYAARQINTNFSLVYVWDSQIGTNILVSADTIGNEPTNTHSHTPAISPDGRYISFVSNAGNLVGNVVSNGFHIYLRDLQAGSTVLVDVDTNGIGSTDNEGTIPVLSADGNLVAFASLGGNLVSADKNSAFDVFVRNVTGGTTELISQRHPAAVSASGNAPTSFSPFSLSADGRWVAFASHASDLIANDTNRAPDVFVRDQLTGSNILVSAGMDGASGRGGFSMNPAISADGRYVAFVSTATNLTSIASSLGQPYTQVYRRDRQSGTTALVSVNPAGTAGGNGDSFSPAISQDGNFVAYLTRANNLGTSSGGAYRRDVNLGTNFFLVNSATNLPPSMSLDGRFVAYQAGTAVRVFDAVAGANVYTSAVNVTSMALSPDGSRLLYKTTPLLVADIAGNSNLISFVSAMPIQSPAPWSANGRFFAFVTASNAVSGGLPADSNGTNDVYLYDLLGRQLTLVSRNAALANSGNGPSDWPVVSGDGRFAAFRSFATNLVAGITSAPNVYLFDRHTGSNSLMSAATFVPGWSPWLARPGISANGGTVVFQSWHSGLVAGDLNRVQDAFVAVVPAAVDSDGDGIPDAWTMQYFGHATGQAGDLSRAQDDADGDGASNLEEYTAGTDPKSAASVFGLQITLVVATDSVTLTWPAATGRVYRVRYKDDLSDSVWQDAPGTVSVIGNLGSYSASGLQAKRFYWISVVP